SIRKTLSGGGGHLPVTAANRPGTNTKTQRRTVRRGLLLQSEVGLRRRIHPTVQEEPLSDTQKTNRNRKNPERDGGGATVSRDRRRAMGLSRDDSVQEHGRRVRSGE